jgi:hypothetical protein
MAAILRQLLLVAVGAVIIYGALALASQRMVGELDKPNVDNANGETGDNLLFGLAPLAGGDRSVVILGASNICEWPLATMEASLGAGTRVHNLCVGAINVAAIESLTQVIKDRLPEARRPNTVLVIGLWYGLFADNQSRWAGFDNTVDQLRLKYRILYSKQDGKVVRVLPTALFGAASTALLPARAISRLRYPVPPGFVQPTDPPPREEAAMVRDFQGRLERVNAHTMGSKPDGAIPAQQFEALMSMVQRLSGEGFKVVLLDLPVARWHADHSLFHATYNAVKAPYFAALAKLPGVSYIDMQSFSDNAFFADGIHFYDKPRNMIAGQAAERLAATLGRGER